MRAWVRERYGPPDVLQLRELTTPIPSEDQVLVRVRAASLNAGDLDYLYGRPWIARLGTGVGRPRNRGLGLDVAGEVQAVGAAVTRFQPGEVVIGDMTEHGHGAFAEYVCAPARAFAPIPHSLSVEEAATVPQAGILAFQGLQHGRPIGPGDRVLINGASGNVGPFAVQIAKALGAEVTGVASGPKLDFVRSLGADAVIDYAAEDFTTTPARFDRILDVAACHPILHYRRALAPGGRYVFVGGSATRLVELVTVGSLVSATGNRRLGLMWWWKPMKQEDITALTGLIEAGKVRPVVDRTYPLDELPDALRYLESGKPRGKIVMTV